MYIILVRIPPDTTANDIVHFLDPVLKKGFFFRKGVIEKIEIKMLHDNSANLTEYHALVKIEPEAMAKKALRKLNRKAINGKHIAVREYHVRNWHNDPRLASDRSDLDFPDRRITDRRRSHMQALANDGVRFSGSKVFHRTY